MMLSNQLVDLQRIVLQEQLNLIRVQDQFIKQHQELTIIQQNQKHNEEMKLLKMKQEIASLKLELLEKNHQPLNQ